MPSNLFEPVPGDYGAHGRFDARARTGSWEMVVSRHRGAVMAGLGLGLLAVLRLATRNGHAVTPRRVARGVAHRSVR